MSKLRRQDLALLETLINSLVTGKSLVHSTGVSLGDVMIWGSDLIVAAIAFVTNNHFISLKTVLQANPKDVNIGPSAAHKRPIDPHNVTRLNGNAHLIADSGTPKLVREPAAIDRESIDLAHRAISSIDGHLAGPVVRAHEHAANEPVVKINLNGK